jgi:hypothetical protein
MRATLPAFAQVGKGSAADEGWSGWMTVCGWEADTLFPRHPSESWDRWRSVDLLEKVTPFRVALFNLLDLPCTLPCLHRFFSGDGVRDLGVRLRIDQPVKAITTAEGGTLALLVLHDPRGQIGGDADIQHPAALIAHDVDPAAHYRELARGREQSQLSLG